MANTMHAGTHDQAFDTQVGETRGKWGWFVALGLITLILGVLAFSNILVATFVSVIYVGVLMIVGGVALIFFAFQVHRWGSFLFWLLSGLLYGAAGILVFFNPALAAGALTLLLAASLVAMGLVRIVVGARSRHLNGWGWVLASGVVTLLVGIIIALGWPANSLWVLGLFLAVDLTFQGVSELMVGLTLRSRRA